MICNKPPFEPLKCNICGYRICNMCYINLLGTQGKYVCENCDYEEFGADSNNNDKPIEKNNKIMKHNNYDILNNNLKIESMN